MILLSHIIDSETPTYGNRDRFISEEISEIKNGDSANSSKWNFTTNHLGTHIDMPKHFFDDGLTITDVPVDFWHSEKVQLIDIPCVNATLIEISDYQEIINKETEVLLIRTGFEKYRKTDKYWNDNPGLSPNSGIWLRKFRSKIKIIGFDFISLSSWKYRNEGKIAHQVFLRPESQGHPICIIEDMALKNFSNIVNKIAIAPVFIKNANGSPVTVYGFK